jgi:hypothetical protein
MIVLDTPHTTTVQYLAGDKVVGATVTDTLYIRRVTIDFTTGALYATIDRGTVNADGEFAQNYPSLDLVVNPDGSFSTADGVSWVGQVDAAPALVAQLKDAFDGFILMSGKVTGKVLTDEAARAAS